MSTKSQSTSHVVLSGKELELAVVQIGKDLGLEVIQQASIGRRFWGAERRIDVLYIDPATRRRLGIECKVQDSPGSAEEKIPALVQDIMNWPFQGIIVFHGNGFSRNMRAYLISTGKAVELEGLRVWVVSHFGL